MAEKERSYDLGGDGTADTLEGGSIMIVVRGRGGLVLHADQVAALRQALNREDELADGFGVGL